MNKTYFVHTVYHLLITLLKIDKFSITRIVMVDLKDEGGNIEKILKKDLLIGEVIKVSEIDFRRNKGIYSKKLKNLNYFQNVIIFNDFIHIGHYLHKKKIEYDLIEDGYNSMQYRNEIKGIKNKIRYFLLRLPKPGGFSKFCKSIEVNDISLVPKDERYPKFIEVPRKQLFENISEERKELLLDIFDVPKLENIEEQSVLILTQPLYNDGLMQSYEEQYEFYKKLCLDYRKQGYVVYLKPHPRDTVTYDDIVNIKFIKKDVPMELIEYVSDIKFKKGITHSSTAMEFITCVDEKIVLYDWNTGKFYEEK